MIMAKVWKKSQVHLIKSSIQDSSCVQASIKGFKNYILKTSIDLDLLRYKHANYIDFLVLKIFFIMHLKIYFSYLNHVKSLSNKKLSKYLNQPYAISIDLSKSIDYI